MDDEIRSRLVELRSDEFKPTLILLPPGNFKELYSQTEKDELKIDGVRADISNIVEDVDRDFVVCFEDSKEDSPLALPTPKQVLEMVEGFEFDELDPGVAEEYGYEKVEEGDLGLRASVFIDVNEKGVEFNHANLEQLNFSADDLHIDEKIEEADDGFHHPVEFAVVSSDFRDSGDSDYGSIPSEEEDVKQMMRQALTDEICEVFYSGEYSYPMEYNGEEVDEKVRIGREFFTFDRVMMPEAG